VDIKDIYSLPIWEGDKIFLKLLEEKAPFFSLKLEYQGDTLVNAVLNGKKICGMLAECGFAGTQCDWIAMGLGLNVRRDALPQELIYASSIEAQTGVVPEMSAIIKKYLEEFDELKTCWEGEGLAPVIERMLPISATVGRDVRVDGVYAKALRIDADGALVCEFAEGIRRVLAGDVSVRGITDYI
jgi:biotin-(acetyl-CoA carboxylase) ligase